MLTGTVTITSGSPVSTIVVTINITVQSPGATLTSLTPSSLPTAVPGSTFTVTLTGANFVSGSLPTQKTVVGIIPTNGTTISTDTNFSYAVLNPSNISLTITVPTLTDGNLPFAVGGVGGPVVIGVCNPGGATCSIPTGQQTLTIAPGPIIQAVTSASSFTEAAPGSSPTTSAYDILSVFGANFCSSGGTGCGSSTSCRYRPTLSRSAIRSPSRRIAERRRGISRFPSTFMEPAALSSPLHRCCLRPTARSTCWFRPRSARTLAPAQWIWW